jgi:hypothetical protein
MFQIRNMDLNVKHIMKLDLNYSVCEFWTKIGACHENGYQERSKSRKELS